MRRRVLPGGMIKLELVLAPDEAELILRAAERAREVEAEEPASNVSAETEASWPSLADGVVRVAESYLTLMDQGLAGPPATGNGGERFQVIVHFEQEVLTADEHWAATRRNASAETLLPSSKVAAQCSSAASTSCSK